jgi:acetyl-CoA acyltransferase
VVVACGVESMSRTKMYSSIQGRDPYGERLRNRFPNGPVSQGISAELVAQRWGLDRDSLDEFAFRSHQRAAEATTLGLFDREVVPVDVHDCDGTVVRHRVDETVRPETTVDSLASLKPAFADDPAAADFPEIDWRVTAGNSSPLTDGASAALIMSEAKATALGLRPRARFHAFAVVGDDPVLTIDKIDAYEVNEAFASVPLAWRYEVDADLERLNPRGGAIALGHPLGASGTRLMATLLNTLESTGGRYGLQTMCEGGGMANATIIERL